MRFEEDEKPAVWRQKWFRTLCLSCARPACSRLAVVTTSTNLRSPSADDWRMSHPWEVLCLAANRWRPSTARGAWSKRQLVTAITERLSCRDYSCQHRMRKMPMLMTTFRQTRETIGEWRRRARSRRELTVLGQFDRFDLGCRFDLNTEMRKPFWQA